MKNKKIILGILLSFISLNIVGSQDAKTYDKKAENVELKQLAKDYIKNILI